MKGYITLLSNKEYLVGVLVLHRSLRAVKSQYPFYCALSQSVEVQVEEALIKEGIRCIRLDKCVYGGEANTASDSLIHWNFTFDKLLVWGLIEFEKLVFLDSDMIVLRNIDTLFEKPSFSAVSADCSYPGNEGWSGGLNSGLIVIEPDVNIANKLCSLVNGVVADFRKKNAAVGDQDVIKHYYKRWASDNMLHLDEGYNIFADHLDYYIDKMGYSLKKDATKPVYVVHFVGKRKPWMKKGWKNMIWLMMMYLKRPAYRTVYKIYSRLMKN